jgi:hypothetical protein
MLNSLYKIDSTENVSNYICYQKLPSYTDSTFIKKLDSLKAKNFFDEKYILFNSKKDSSNTIYSTSIFVKHQLSPKKYQTNELTNTSSDWLFLVQLLGILIFTWVIVSFRKRLKQIFSSLFTNRAINQLIRDGDLLKQAILFPLLSIYFLSVSLLISTFLLHYKVVGQTYLIDFFVFIKVLFIIFLLSFIKNIFIRFISNTFRNQMVTSYYLLNGNISNIIIGILLIPLLFLYSFADNFISDKLLIFCIIIVILINIIRIVRNITSSFNYSKFSSLYLFLYLCTVELLPIIIIVKLFNRFISF